jgi:23S rRNA (guanosine2251-2'-O)-methyltransferase
LKENSSKEQIIFGRHPIIEALESGKSFEKIIIKSGMTGDFVHQLNSLCKHNKIAIKKVPQIKLDKLARFRNHQGVVGFISLVEYQNLRDIVPFLFEHGKTPLFIMLDGITDVRNLGAIARSAEVLGCHAIIVGQNNNAVINQDAIKTSAGALLKIPVCRSENLKDTLNYLRASGVSVVCSDMNSKNDLDALDLTGPIALVMGSEGAGVSFEVLEASGQTFRIPQVGQIESLNVSVASGIALYECLRQRKLLK